MAAVALVCGMVLLAGCGDDSSSESASTEKAEETTSTPSGSETELPEVVEWEAERVADLGTLAIDSPQGTEDAIIGIQRSSGPTGGSTALIKIGADGTVGEPVAVADDGPSVTTLFSTTAGVFASGSSYGTDTTLCGYFPVDANTLALGAGVNLTPEGSTSCRTGSPFSIDGDLATFVGSTTIAEANTSDGTARITDVVTDHPQYEVLNAVTFGDAHYVTLRAGFDSNTGNSYTAPDGGELPQVIVRVAADTMEVTASAEIPGTLTVSGDELFAVEYPEVDEGTDPQEIADPTVLAIDPETLDTSEADLPAGGSGCLNSGAPADLDLVWVSADAQLLGLDRSTCERTATATIDDIEGASDTTYVNQQVVSVGGEPYVLTSVMPDPDPTSTEMAMPVATVLDRLTPP
jgi:hypothetical protein